MSSQFFPNAQNFQITGGNFNHINGDQINYTTLVQAERKELTVLDEYYYVKRGAIYKLRENGRYLWEKGERWRSWVRRLGRANRVSYAVEIVDRPGKVFTLVEYSGPEAKQAFEKDFAMLISELTLNGAQVYGYNLSAAPSILMYNELVPAAQVNAGIIGRVYLSTIRWQLRCRNGELWLDPARGVFCRGLPGPTLQLTIRDFGSEELPLTAELVQEDVLLRFLAGLKSKHVDDVVVIGVAFSGALTDVPERVVRPTVISTLTNAPIVVANNTWTSFGDSLSDGKLLADGMARFTLAGGDSLLLEWNWDAKRAWMAQAWSVFGARGISMEDDLSVYHLLFHRASLSGRLSYSEARRQFQKPIYLFVRPLPFDLDDGRTSSVHFWSFDEDGHSPLSRNLCLDFGLPTTFGISQFSWSCSWSSDAYDSLRQYQILRGFDPSTADFAQSLGFDKNIFQPLSDSDRFAQVNQELSLMDGASTSAAQISALEDPTATHPAQKSSEHMTSSTRQTSLSTHSVAETAVKYDTEPESTASLSAETEGPSNHWAKPGFLKKWCTYYISSTHVYVEVLMYNLQVIWCRRLLPT
ncbi:hypothetical protein PQX77_017987 [Marasmius sp. AFHP31]|nr:hypothetical protein PQX77_017987 [Marasmius sp. AFHP31]